MGKIVMTLALTLASLGSSGGRTQAEMNPLFWEVCPYVVEVGAEVIKARLRLKLNSEDLGPAFDILCRVGKYYDQDQEKSLTPPIPSGSESFSAATKT